MTSPDSVPNMIQIKRITTHEQELYTYMEQLLQHSFPHEEYRDLPQLRTITDGDSRFHNHVILNGKTPIGLVTCWDFSLFRYIEHFAIDPAHRNGGIGRQILAELCPQWQPIVLEVECPDNEMAVRRIDFYRRQGFVLWERPYLQPPYRQGDGFLPMHLMVYGPLDQDTSFNRIQKCLYTEVYKQDRHPSGE